MSCVRKVQPSCLGARRADTLAFLAAQPSAQLRVAAWRRCVAAGPRQRRAWFSRLTFWPGSAAVGRRS
eukprot:5281770-Pyramimonas_sp.AAC.1